MNPDAKRFVWSVVKSFLISVVMVAVGLMFLRFVFLPQIEAHRASNIQNNKR